MVLPTEPSLIDQMAKKDLARWDVFVRAVEYVNFERVEGDILEFGVFGGTSLALLARAQQLDPKGMPRRAVGFDSFEGLPDSSHSHERWQTGDCATMHSWHPLLSIGEPVSEQTCYELFERCELSPPAIETGAFDETLSRTIPGEYSQAAVVHIDCDLYESTKTVLCRVEPILQPGCVLLFDDWFHYQGNPERGEAKAFSEFLDVSPWKANHYCSYGTFGNAFILYRSEGDGDT